MWCCAQWDGCIAVDWHAVGSDSQRKGHLSLIHIHDNWLRYWLLLIGWWHGAMLRTYSSRMEPRVRVSMWMLMRVRRSMWMVMGMVLLMLLRCGQRRELSMGQMIGLLSLSESKPSHSWTSAISGGVDRLISRVPPLRRGPSSGTGWCRGHSGTRAHAPISNHQFPSASWWRW